MDRLLLLFAPLALLLHAGRQPDGREAASPEPGPPTAGPGDFALKEESITLEYTAEVDEAVLRVTAESETELGFVEVRGPDGELLLEIAEQGGGRRGLSGFELELDEVSGQRLLELYRAGVYGIQARSLDGRTARGSAVLSFELPPVPRVVYPLAGSVGVPTRELEVLWEPDARASGYRVVLEQDENDGLVVHLPAGSSSLRVPAGLLRPDAETQLEIATLAENGNATLVEVPFRTR